MRNIATSRASSLRFSRTAAAGAAVAVAVDVAAAVGVAGADAEAAEEVEPMTHKQINLGLGIGWRAPIALLIERRRDLGFIEVIAEHFDPDQPVPPAIRALQSRGVRVVPH